MQLFISDYIHIDQNISINNKDILSQLRTVLRYRVGDVFYIQKPIYKSDFDNDLIHKDMKISRYKVQIIDWDRSKLNAKVIGHEDLFINLDKKSIIISMPNKWEKLELICQKLTEIGIQNITIYFAKRSIIKTINDNKVARIYKIIKESVEQSYGVVIPNLLWKENITFGSEGLVLYQGGEDANPINLLSLQDIISIVIGPEGGWDKSELELFENYGCRFVSIGPTILRTETAAIIGGWILKSLS